MRYITSVERMALQEGRQEGRQEGLQEGRQEGLQLALLHLLQHRFGTVSEAVRLNLQALNAQQLDALFDVVLTANTISEFVASLPPVPSDESSAQN